MSKKEKKLLSKAVGEWDNGFSDRKTLMHIAINKYHEQIEKMKGISIS